MNRTLLSIAAAAAGLTGVVALTPHLSPGVASASTTLPHAGAAAGSGTSGHTKASGGSTSAGSGAASGSGASAGSGSAPGSSGSGSSAGSTTAPSGTVTGDVANQRFGPIQVEITVAKGTITDIQLLQQPSDGRSRWINSQAVPILVSQALQAQSTSIDGVSGATLTSQAFVTSLASALQKAGL